MTSVQKVIKYIAIAFAIFLTVTIISAILGGFFAVAGVLGLKNAHKKLDNNKEEIINIASIESNDIKTLEIDLAYTSLSIKNGEAFKIDTNNSNITYKQDNNNLKIEDETRKWYFATANNYELILYIPDNYELENVKITTGAGEISIDSLNVNKLEFELGAGKIKIDNLNVADECNIEGGAGELNILSGTINDLDLDMGVGETNIIASLIGKNQINAGVGSLNIKLQDNKENYKIKVNKGIGNITVDGKGTSDGEVFGNGDNKIDIDGGIGNITVDFE